MASSKDEALAAIAEAQRDGIKGAFKVLVDAAIDSGVTKESGAEAITRFKHAVCIHTDAAKLASDAVEALAENGEIA